MIDTASLKTVDPIENTELSVQMDSIPPCDMNNIYNIYDEKEFKKYIQEIEKTVRRSPEYQWFINYIRKYMNMNESLFLDQLSCDGPEKVKIEQHHTPFTLYDIVVIVFNKRMFYQESLSPRMVAEEVMQCHYMLIVGLVPLTKTEHKLVHNGYLFVPTDKILGNYQSFIAQYGSFMLPEHRDVLERIEEHTKYYNEEENTRVLEQRTIKVNPQLPEYKRPELDDVLHSMYTRIEEVKDNGYRLPVLNESNIAPQVPQQQGPVSPFEYIDPQEPEVAQGPVSPFTYI